MDPPTVEEKIKTAELEDVQLEEVKETKPAAIEEDDALFHCDLFDAEMVQKVADEFLPGLASACIDNTTGGLLNSPASVAVDIRREMVDYLVQRSEMFVAESVVLEGDSVVEVSDNPHDIISDFIDDFAQSKRNFFCKVSSWMLSERREERIDDFVQEMEMNGFWLMARRIAVAQTSIRNIDFKNIYHCSMRFKSEEELSKHITLCGFRELHCENEGCNARFSAAQLELHDSTCPFKILQCEQKCPETLMRREMDRHCITVCPMKLANCPFYPVGCVSTIPQCKTDQHRLENLLPHLTHILKLIHKEASFEALKKRAEHLLEASSPGRLAAARDARSLTVAIKRIDAKLGPLEAEEIKEDNADDADLKNEKKDSTDLSAKKDSSDLSAKKDSSDLSAKKDSSDLSAIKDSTDLSAKKDSSDLSAKKDSTDLSAIKDSTDLSAKKDSSDLSAKKDSTDLSAKKDSTDLSAKKDSSDLSAKKDSTDLSAKKDCSIDLSHNDEQSPQLNSSASPHKTVSPDKSEKVVEPTVTDSTNEHCEKPDSRDLPHYKNDGLKSPDKGEESLSTSEKHQDVTTSAHKLESPKSEDPPKSPEKHHNSTTSEEQKE